MTKTSEKSSKTPTVLGLIVCVGALPLLYGITGCSTGKPLAQTRGGEEYASMVGPAGPGGPAGPEGATGRIGDTGAPGAGVAGLAGEQGRSRPSRSRRPTRATG